MTLRALREGGRDQLSFLPFELSMLVLFSPGDCAVNEHDSSIHHVPLIPSKIVQQVRNKA